MMAYSTDDIADPAVRCDVCYLYVRASQLWWHQHGFMHALNAGLAYIRENWISSSGPGDYLDRACGVYVPMGECAENCIDAMTTTPSSEANELSPAEESE